MHVAIGMHDNTTSLRESRDETDTSIYIYYYDYAYNNIIY